MQENRYEQIFGSDFEKFKLMIGKYQKFSIRTNTLKIGAEGLSNILKNEGFVISQVPWCQEGFFIENLKQNGSPTKLREHKEGLFLVQNASSMVPPLVLNPTGKDNVLDMCASPGSKTTQMAAMMDNKGSILAAENVGGRMKALNGNLKKMGVTNTKTFLGDVKTLVGQNKQFDKILLDAPCTGTGSLEPYLLKRSHKGVKQMSHIQRNLIAAGYDLLKSGGVLVYSTCSLEPEENEDVIDYAIKKLGMKVVDIQVEGLAVSPTMKSWKDYEFHEDVSKCVRVLPTVTGTEGFFVAKLTK